MATARCSDCLAEIVWARTPGGRPLPVDAEPTAEGKLLLTETPEGLEARYCGAASIQPDAWLGGYFLHLSHLATCPHAKRERERRKQANSTAPEAS